MVVVDQLGAGRQVGFVGESNRYGGYCGRGTCYNGGGSMVVEEEKSVDYLILNLLKNATDLIKYESNLDQNNLMYKLGSALNWQN